MSVQMSGTFPPQQGTSNYANASQQPGPYPNMGMMPGQQGRPFANAMNTMSMPPINAPPGMSMPPPGVGRSQPMNVNTSSIPNKMMAPPPGMTTMNPNMMQQRSMAPPPQSSNTPPTSSSSSSSAASKFPSMSGGYSDMMGMYNKGPGPASYTQAVLTMQQQQQQQQPQMKPPVLSKQQQQESEFSLVTEDFPALPGYKESGGGQQQQSQQQQQQNFYNQQQQFKAMSQQQGGQQQQNYVMNEPPRNMSSYEQFLIQRQQQQGGQQQQQQTPQQMPPNQQQQQQQQKQFVPDRYGLLGLLSVIRMIDADLNTLALGTELTTLGLNLNSPDCLYSTFASPWAEGPSRREPEYYIPMCYYTPNPLQSPFLRMNLYSEETLLYIFYSMPRDMLQIAAASELHRRDWRYHKEHKLWLTRAPNTEPTQKTPTFERGSYIFFDTTSWDKVRKDNFVLMYDQIEPPSNAATNVMNNATSAAVTSNPQVVV